MKGRTHILFGMGFVGIILYRLDFWLWAGGTLILAPIFSRLPDYDQKISRIAFNQIVPHRGKWTHNLLFGLPLGLLLWIPPEMDLVWMGLVGSFGALFAHVFADAFNYGGVWVGFIKLKVGKFSWDSLIGNLAFKVLGLIALGFALVTYLV
ncbi:MAG: metal-dependent hydrolase [Candidatus Thorarchaeota archaeon]